MRMRRLRMSCRVLALLLIAFCLPAYAGGDPLQRLSGPDALAGSSIDEWSLVPLGGARFEGGARLDPRQELRFSSVPTGYGISSSLIGTSNFWAAGARAPGFDAIYGIDQTRATYRYTWLSSPDIDLKVGLTSNLTQFGLTLRNPLSSPLRFGALPQMHLSGVGRLNSNWHVSLDADGLWTARGRALDLGLQVGYRVNRSFQFYGGYRVTDLGGEAEDAYGTSINSANVGLRYSF